VSWDSSGRLVLAVDVVGIESFVIDGLDVVDGDGVDITADTSTEGEVTGPGELAECERVGDGRPFY
jgi:hypothetical protein